MFYDKTNPISNNITDSSSAGGVRTMMALHAGRSDKILSFAS